MPKLETLLLFPASPKAVAGPKIQLFLAATALHNHGLDIIEVTSSCFATTATKATFRVKISLASRSEDQDNGIWGLYIIMLK